MLHEYYININSCFHIEIKDDDEYLFVLLSGVLLLLLFLLSVRYSINTLLGNENEDRLDFSD